MPAYPGKKSFLILLFVFAAAGAKAQGGFCPPNMDLEMGDFTNWTCHAGTVNLDPATGLNTITWASSGPPIFDRHTIIPLAGAGNDYYGGFPRICPNGSGYSALLGNNTASLNGGVGREASGISYTYTIPATATIFSVFFHYAVILQLPNHLPEQQPRFRARIKDLTSGGNIPCVDFDFTASSSLPGFRPSPADPGVIYKDWTPVTLNLSGLAGRTIELEFIVSECTQNGHFAYAYVDVNSNCNGAISGSTICAGDTAITLTAPYGFQSYTWYSDLSFTTVLSNSQSLVLDPAPPVGSVYPVRVIPYPGFGCEDTLEATITVSPKPVSDAGPDVSICQSAQTPIGAPGTPGLNYAWTPVTQVSNPISPNPMAWTVTPNPETFIVKTTDVLTGCFSYDTVVISTTKVDTVITVTGKREYCLGDPLAGSLAVNNTVTSVQWYDASGPIPGATGLNYSPTASGPYWAQVSNLGCVDSTNTYPFLIHDLPVAGFTPLTDTACSTSNTRLYNNTSVSTDGSMSYTWLFSDGDVQTTTDANKTFTGTGVYGIKLVTTTQYGCKDSINGSARILPNGIPDFSWDTICVNRPVTFINLSNENTAPAVSYNWIFNDGGPGSTVKNPPPVTYSTAGTVDVTLELTALGCENDPQSVTKPVPVFAPAPGVRYRSITVPMGSSRFIHVRDSIGTRYNWTPAVQLSSYHTPYTEFFASGNDVEYRIEITDKNTCITVDTLLMQILKEPGYYLPTAFTPNGDGLNDLARPYLIGMKGLKRFSIFNRWGNLVFHTVKEGEGWDGRYKGLPQEPGVFVWLLEYITPDDKVMTAKGTITVIR